MEFDQLSAKVLGCAIEVHRELGPGLLESAYQRCLVHELKLASLKVDTRVPISLEYKGLRVHNAYYADILVANTLLLELKCVDCFTTQHTAQILTYLKLLKLECGLLLNFSLPTLRQGMQRVVRSL